ncbi:ATP-grasp domain-containing protein [Candidatus Daviesbacteria bacterium]|nr:ATP-grasp domain-containing protein [Candidatus Daviesbacteria bacterium]
MVKKILITGIGGNVAHGVLRNILNLKINAILVGTDIKKVSAGNHLCDKTYQVPISSSAEYIPSIIKICKKDGIDLIIPTTDSETYYLALAREKLPVLAASDAKVAHTFLNKYATWLAFKKFNIPFAETRLPSEYKNDFKEIIVKPMEGTGSKGIQINPKNPNSFPDDYIIQKLYKGEEITTGFYVTKDKKLLGLITFKRSLYHGTTTMCEITSKYDSILKKLINRIVKHFDIRGSCDMQSIATENDQVIPFELNCRLSGTNSIRGEFGFEDVRYTIDEYLFNKNLKKPTIKKGSSIKIWVDIVYPNISLEDIKDRSTKHYIVKYENK